MLSPQLREQSSMLMQAAWCLQGSSSRSSSRSDNLTRHPSWPEYACKSWQPTIRRKSNHRSSRSCKATSSRWPGEGESRCHENPRCKVMVPISASELYNGVEKKVFVFPRPPGAGGKQQQLTHFRDARLMICRGCKEDPGRPQGA